MQLWALLFGESESLFFTAGRKSPSRILTKTSQELIEETRTGLALGGDKMEIANAIEQLYLEWRVGSSAWNPEWKLIHRYQHRRITTKLAEEFNGLIESGGTG